MSDIVAAVAPSVATTAQVSVLSCHGSVVCVCAAIQFIVGAVLLVITAMVSYMTRVNHVESHLLEAIVAACF